MLGVLFFFLLLCVFILFLCEHRVFLLGLVFSSFFLEAAEYLKIKSFFYCRFFSFAFLLISG